MKLLHSDKLKLPSVYFITDRKEIKELPIGVPFIYADAESEKYLVRLLEYEILYQAALRTGYPFDFRKILADNGYKDIYNFGYSFNSFIDFTSEGYIHMDDEELEKLVLDPSSEASGQLEAYIKDSSVYVDITVLKDLKIFPIWLEKIEEAVMTNIHSFATFNNNMYNKKLEGMYGGIELSAPNRNLFVIDISSSVPRGVSSTCLAMVKNLAETFFADIIITGSVSRLYMYEELHTLDITKAYDNGMNNDQIYFKAIVTADARHYDTAIVFGDNDSPCSGWQGGTTITREEGKKLCKWTINKLISFHTKGTTHLAAYSDWFTVPESNIQRIDNWVKYLN